MGAATVTNWATVLFWLGVFAPWTAWATQAADVTMAYIERGHHTEARQRAYHERMERFHQALSEALRQGAPDLLPKLEPPPPTVFGYGILPRIVPDTPPPLPIKPQVVRFSWVWSDTLIAQENAAIDRLEADLAKVRADPSSATHAAYEALVMDYKTRVDSRRPIDSDIDYNWLWQKAIAENRPLFDRLEAKLEAEVERQSQGAQALDLTGPTIGFDPPAFVRIEQPAAHEHLITVPIYTDITDPAAVQAFVAAVETHWHVRAGDEEFRVRLEMTTIAPDQLYCGRGRAAPTLQTGVACAAPAMGAKIDLAAHSKQFPEDGAALTTGAASLQLSGRALVLGSHDVSPRTLAHEFGHLLGFPDEYLRGYRDLGADGFQVLEFIVDRADIMSSSGSGSVLARHFQGLIVAREIQMTMQAGVAALYQRSDPVEAVARFREVLARNPTHFGATLQLAKALDRAGRPDDALVVWRKMLDMAEAVQNTETAATARARLALAR